MKKLLIITLMFVGAKAFSQICWSSNIIENNPAKSQLYSTGHIAVPTKNMDTLYVPNDDMGRTIMEMWNLYPTSKKSPVIVFMSDEQLLKMFVLIYDSREDKGRMVNANKTAQW